MRICRARGSGSAVAWRDSRGRRKQAEWGGQRVSSWAPGGTAGSSAAVTAEAEARSEFEGRAGDVR